METILVTGGYGLVGRALKSDKYKLNHSDAILKDKTTIIKGVPFFCYSDQTIFQFENVKKINVCIYNYNLNKRCKILKYIFDTDKVSFEKVNNFITIYSFEIVETINDNIKCSIKNIL